MRRNTKPGEWTTDLDSVSKLRELLTCVRVYTGQKTGLSVRVLTSA